MPNSTRQCKPTFSSSHSNSDGKSKKSATNMSKSNQSSYTQNNKFSVLTISTNTRISKKLKKPTQLANSSNFHTQLKDLKLIQIVYQQKIQIAFLK